jgi:autotransporter-associated beta strand protein
LFVADQAKANCITSGSTVTCDASFPNPARNGVTGTTVNLLSGATVQVDDPYAFASPRLQTVIIQPDGSLTAAVGSQVYDTAVGGAAVSTGANSTIYAAGRISALRNNAVGVLLGGNGTITVAQGGIVETVGNGSIFSFQNSSAGIAASGDGTTMQIDGTVQTFGDNAPAIRPYSIGLFNSQFYTSAITVGATGVVAIRGANAPAISIAGGSSVTVGGRVSASGAGSSAILYQAGSGTGVTISVLSGDVVEASQAPAITGTGADVDLSIAGRVAGGSASQPAIALGSGNDRVTIFTGAAVTGTIDGGTGTDQLALTGSGNGTLSGTANFEALAVNSGNWTASGAQSYATAATIGAGAMLTGSITTPSYTVAAGGTLTSGGTTISSSGQTLAIDNSGTIESTGGGARAINVSGKANARTITLINRAGGVIQSEDDAFRINTDLTGGSVIVMNAGTIRTTNGGQAIDFDAIESDGATIRINNLAGGVLQSYGADAVRSGQGSIIDNAGLIRSDGVPGDSNDGIDMQGHNATVINEVSGTISGQRHGITSDTGLDVTNYGAITGRNGSGVGSDGNGTVVNYGTITGAYDGLTDEGDGDGVDIDFIAHITNSGTIQGTGAAGSKDGSPNASEGIAAGGGTIVNSAGALISGKDNGILVDDGNGNTGYGATSITNSGSIRGVDGFGIKLVGDYDDTIVNSGTISGGNGLAIDMGAGNDQLTLLPGSTITGTIDGGDGNDQVTLAGTGKGSFAGAVNFEHLDVVSGDWTLTGASTFADGTGIESGASLTGTSDTLTGAIVDDGALVVDQAANGTLTASLGGTGLLRKTGAGTLTIGSQPSFTGRTDVDGGTLMLAGSLPSVVTVESGATLAGTGAVASATILKGGTIAPDVGTLQVAGHFDQQAGSTYAATILAGGSSSRIAVGDTAAIGSGATISIDRVAGGSYAIGTRYTLLTAAGGITGAYTLNQTTVDGVELRLVADDDTLFADLVRTGASLRSLAVTRNQAAVASALGALDAGNSAYAALTPNPDDDAVRGALTQLSGEIHASAKTAQVHDAMLAEGAVLSRIETAGDQHGLWGQFLGGHGEDDGTGGGGNTERNTYGGIGGYDVALGDDARAGLAAGYTHTRLTLDGRAGSATLDTGHVLGYTGGAFGALRLRAGIGYAWSRINTRRTVSFAGFSDHDDTRYDGDVLHAFGELGYAVPVAGGTVEPFIGGSALRVHNDGFTERGGDAALAGLGHSDTVEFSEVGLKIATPVVENVTAHAGVAWQHAFGAVSPDAVLRFDGGDTTFSVTGAHLSRDAVTPTLDISWQMAPKVRLTAGYTGLIGRQGSENSGRLALGIAF